MATKKPRIAASQSFTPEEVSWLDQLFKVILRGGTTRVLMRAPQAKSMIRKVQRMQGRVEHQRALRLVADEEE